MGAGYRRYCGFWGDGWATILTSLMSGIKYYGMPICSWETEAGGFGFLLCRTLLLLHCAFYTSKSLPSHAASTAMLIITSNSCCWGLSTPRNHSSCFCQGGDFTALQTAAAQQHTPRDDPGHFSSWTLLKLLIFWNWGCWMLPCSSQPPLINPTCLCYPLAHF